MSYPQQHASNIYQDYQGDAPSIVPDIPVPTYADKMFDSVRKERTAIEEAERELGFRKATLVRREAIAKMRLDREQPRVVDKRVLIPPEVDERYRDFWEDQQATLERDEAIRLADEQRRAERPWWRKVIDAVRGDI